MEPAARFSSSVCLPRQPWPLRAASSTSSTFNGRLKAFAKFRRAVHGQGGLADRGGLGE